MRAIRSSILVGGLLLSALASAEVQVQGPVEYGIFISNAKEFAPGERLLTRSDQVIEPTQVIPAKLGSKFGLRYTLAGKQVGDAPLTLLYLTPGVVTPDGLRHDKFVVQQPMVQGAGADLMAGRRLLWFALALVVVQVLRDISLAVRPSPARRSTRRSRSVSGSACDHASIASCGSIAACSGAWACPRNCQRPRKRT